MTVFICLHGWELRGDYCYLVFIVTAIIFFKKNSHRVFLLGLIIICYFFSVYYTNNYPAILKENVSDWNSPVIFLAMLFSTTIIIARFVADNESYQNKLTDALKALQKEQEKIEIQNKTLASVNKDLERFAYISSHNLKTPIRTIRSFADLIGRDLKKGKQENLTEYLDFIKQGASQMQLLITDILEYSQFNQQKTFETIEVDLNQTISFIHFQLQSFTDKTIHIEVSELPIIQSNRTFINAVFQNLIENGVKYNETKTVEITVSYEDNGDKHLFLFKDNGIGIDAAYHDKIFEMFERLQTDSKYTGSGVGLGMSKKIIEKLNGKIWVDSTLGQGSTFYVELPKRYA
jgi:light-regulated signal transduction histidine kinase (bacteriophytochrome)